MDTSELSSRPEDAPLTASTLLAAGWIAAAAAMVIAYAVHLRLANAGVVDAAWAFVVGVLGTGYAVGADGWVPRRMLVAGMMLAWSLRLGGFIVRDRLVGGTEDARYRTLRAGWGRRAPTRFFWFFQAQAVAAVFFSLPACLIAFNTTPAWHPLELAALGLWLTGLTGESTADAQLTRFKHDPRNAGRTCRDGLWRYSRHPNYFFEWTIWVALALMALPAPWGVIALACPLVMLYLLLRVTGIPATEAQAVQSRGDDYRRYQATTSRFIPWKPR